MPRVLLRGVYIFILFTSTVYLADAQASRTWVSGVGDDVNPCSRTAPCKTFAGAISKTAVNGEINCLDPGGFGSVTITKSINIDCSGTLGSVLAPQTNGIVINGDGAVVSLRGLDINGIRTGLCGIRISAASKVYIENTVIDGFTQAGVWLENAGDLKVVIKNTSIKNNTGDGIYAVPKGTSDVFVGNSLLSGNGNGVRVDSSATVRISDSSIVFNDAGLVWRAPGKILSFQNNTVDGNAKNGAPTATVTLQ